MRVRCAFWPQPFGTIFSKILTSLSEVESIVVDRCVRMNEVEKKAMEAQPKRRELPVSKYNLDTYFGRVRVPSSHSWDRLTFDSILWTLLIHGWNQLRLSTDCRTLLVSRRELSRSKELVRDYQYGRITEMNDDLWRAKKSIPPTCK